MEEMVLDSNCIFRAVQFVCHVGAQSETRRPEEHLGSLFPDVLIVPYLDFREMNTGMI
jgi:hypothetical protein